MCFHIYSVLVNKYGYTYNFAVAALNNMAAESAFSTIAINDDNDPSNDANPTKSYTSAGICQWDWEPRLDDFLEYIGDNPKNYTDKKGKLDKMRSVDLDTQIAFMNYEIEEKYNHNNDMKNDLYYQAYNENTQYSLDDQSRNFTNCFENPADAAKQAEDRLGYTSSIETLINANRIETID